jgi:hypothetical protein
MGANPAVNNIARWNGTAWEALYPSAPFGTVLALAVYHGELIAAGVLQTPTSTPSIMRWDETAWVPVGGGVTDPFGGFVYGLAVVGDELIAGGRFHSMGGTPADHVARWDGTAWRALGAGTDVDVDTIYAAGAGALVTGLFLQAGGMPISHFARWSPPARACAADFDCSGAVDSQDFLNFLTAFFALDPGADFNHSGAIDSQDFFDFLTALFAGC